MNDGTGEKKLKAGQPLPIRHIDVEILFCAIEGKQRLDCKEASIKAENLIEMALERYSKLDLSSTTIEELISNLHAKSVDCSGRSVDVDIFRERFSELRQAKGAPFISPKGIKIENAIIEGQLDFEDSEIKFPLSFHNCIFLSKTNEPTLINIRDASTQSLIFMNCQIYGGINARRLQTDGNLRLQGCKLYGPLSLMGARIGRNLEIGSYEAKGRPAGPGVKETYDRCYPSVFHTPDENSRVIEADRMTIGSSLLMENVNARGGVRLVGSHIFGKLDAVGARVCKADGKAFDAYRIRVDGDLMLSNCRFKGETNFRGAKIGGDFECENSTFINHAGSALEADRIEIANNLRLGPNAKIIGVVRFPGAHIKGQMRLEGTRINAGKEKWIALYARGIKVEASVYLTEFIEEDGTQKPFISRGEVNFDSAEITDSLKIKGVRLHKSPVKKGDLNGDHYVHTHEDSLHEKDDTALSLEKAVIGHLIMPERSENVPGGIINLTRARVGIYEDFAATWPSEEKYSENYLMLNGFSYDHLKNPAGNEKSTGRKSLSPAKQRIKWLNCQSKSDLGQKFRPGPWLQVARVLKSQGYPDNARDVAIKQRRLQAKTYQWWSPRRWQNNILYYTSLYGFRPSYTLFWMFSVIALYTGLWAAYVSDCDKTCWQNEQLFVRSAVDEFSRKAGGAPVDVYPDFNPFYYSFDSFVPVFEFKYEHSWMIRTSYCPLSFEVLRNIVSQSSIVKGCAKSSASTNHGSKIARPAWWRPTMGKLAYILYILEVLLGIVLSGIAVTGFAGYLGKIE